MTTIRKREEIWRESYVAFPIKTEENKKISDIKRVPRGDSDSRGLAARLDIDHVHWRTS